ncbi:hypothetical protein SAY86_018748 [Trapa natans]|uniref:Protodermal factor 1 n=1 Tax=Trapa natans TaxID=22666 RepID=A0AAN7LFK1_TRANT|nr:hypothetical protein SAY86_018748 [Trapa natans]
MKLFAAVFCLLALSSTVPVMPARLGLGDNKSYYPPDGTPPPVPVHHGSPPQGSSPPYHNPTPTPPVNCEPPPPPANCESPPSYVPTPSTPTYSPPSGGGGSYTPPPYSGGGTPPYSGGGTPPTPIFTPGTPTIPTTPIPFDPNTPFPGTCNYWRNNPMVIWGLVGWYATIGNVFGGFPTVAGFPSNFNLLQALSNTRNDGYGALFREGTASLLNSMASTSFPFTTPQVRKDFVSALGSNGAALAQSEVFRTANEGHFKPRA